DTVHVWATEEVTLRLPVFVPAHAPLPILQATIALPTRLTSLKLFMMMRSLRLEIDRDSDGIRIRLRGNVLGRRHRAAHREGLCCRRAPGNAAPRIHRAAYSRAPYGAARTAGPRARGGRLRDAVVQKIRRDRGALKPALRSRDVRAGIEIDCDSRGAFSALDGNRARARERGRGIGDHGIVGPERERRGRGNRACLGDRGGDAQAPGAASGARQAARAAEQQRYQEASCRVFHYKAHATGSAQALLLNSLQTR